MVGEAVSDPSPLSGARLTPAAVIISFDILLYFQHIARVIDLRCLFRKEPAAASDQS